MKEEKYKDVEKYEAKVAEERYTCETANEGEKNDKDEEGKKKKKKNVAGRREQKK